MAVYCMRDGQLCNRVLVQVYLERVHTYASAAAVQPTCNQGIPLIAVACLARRLEERRQQAGQLEHNACSHLRFCKDLPEQPGQQHGCADCSCGAVIACTIC
jgi:hypothetical protein